MAVALTAPAQQGLDVLADQESRGINVNEIATDMKNSGFFRQNWDTLLLAAPNCLEILGNVNLVAATPWAEATPLKGTFIHLKNSDYLRGALACIPTQGSRSFLVARVSMTKIKMDAGSVHDQVRIIYKGLANPSVPMAIAEQTVKSATTKLTATRETYVATLDTYRKTSENLQQVKETLHQAREEIKALDAKKLSLEKVKKVLVSCISYLIELKDRIRKLVIFFSNLASMIELCVEKQVMPFVSDLELYAKMNSSKAELYDSYYRDVIFRMVLQILSSLSLYRDVATMYIDVDEQNLSNDAFFERQRKTLSEYNTEAEEKVHEIVKAKQEEILGKTQDRIQSISNTFEQFPAQFRPQPGSIEARAAKDGAGLLTATAEAEVAKPSALEVMAPKRRFRHID
ncbi:hypothetical protein QBC44DRAFT_365557 [Cladorrhinum sp. PSN332]|nr:hypothetical protein QBC44DRAFT_365557 [Cladorrhinum sp. PSN332]